MPPIRSFLPVSMLLLPLVAQQVEPAPPPPPDPALLDAALAALGAAGSGTFRSYETSDLAMLRRMRGMMPAPESDVDGRWHRDWLQYALEDGSRLLAHGGRRVVENEDGEWRLRQNSDATGQPLPFLFDPALFLAALHALPAEARQVRHVDTSKSDAGRVTFGITLEKQPALDFYLSGAMPAGSGPIGGMLRIGRGGPVEPPEVTVDLAFELDLAAKRVERIRVLAYRRDRMPANVEFRTAGGEEIEVEARDEATKELDEAGNRLYRNGLPVRKLDGELSQIELTVRFKELGSAAAPELPDAAKALLSR